MSSTTQAIPDRANPPEVDPVPDFDRLIHGFDAPAPSVGIVYVGGRKATLLIWPAKTWGWMNFPPGMSRASGGEWFTARVD